MLQHWFLGYLSFSTVDSKAPVAVAAGKTYSGTVYVAGMGGHFAKADVTIDPSNANEPVKINSLDRVVIGDKKLTRPMTPASTSNDPNIMFWSTYVPRSRTRRCMSARPTSRPAR